MLSIKKWTWSLSRLSVRTDTSTFLVSHSLSFQKRRWLTRLQMRRSTKMWSLSFHQNPSASHWFWMEFLSRLVDRKTFMFAAREILGRSSRQQSNGTRTRTPGWRGTIFARETDVVIDGSRAAESKLQSEENETFIDIAFPRPSRTLFLNPRSRNPPVQAWRWSIMAMKSNNAWAASIV